MGWAPRRAGDAVFAGVQLEPDTLIEVTGAGATRRVATFPLNTYFDSSIACVVRVDGSVACGSEDTDQVGYDNTSSPFVVVAGVAQAVDVAVGRDVACAVVTNGAVWCWGEGPGGELGRPLRSSATPVNVEGLTDATSITASGSTTFCARSTSRGLVCWGNDTNGELGRGVARSVTLVP